MSKNKVHLTEEAKENMRKNLITLARKQYDEYKKLLIRSVNNVWVNDDGGFSTTEDLKELCRKIHCASVETSKCMDKISEYKADVKILSDDKLWEKYCK